MRRHLPRLLMTGALLSPASLYALGLGEIRLNSALNQPFDADIELIAPTNEELSNLKIGLASNDLFSRYGLDRPQFLSTFEFSVARRRDGNASIKVTSNRSVTEPFVTLLVEASWGRGRLLREYTVLLDPPAFSPSQPEATAPVAAPASGARNERIERAPAEQPSRPAATPAPSAPATVPSPRAGSTGAEARDRPRNEAPEVSSDVPTTGSYTVERNDTLWRIASKARPGSSPSVINKTMIALFRANPAAFGGNINRLRAGSILRIPESAEIDSIPSRDATAEVARQQDAWRGGTESTDAANRLRLVTPAETPPASAPAPATPVERPTATTPPVATAPARPAPAAPDKRLEVTNPGLASAQRNAAETPPAATPEVAPPAPTAEPTPPVAETPPAPAAQTPAAPAPAAAPAEEEGPSLLSRLGDFWWVFVVLGLLVVAWLAVSKRRRDSGDPDTVDSLSSLDYEPPANRMAATSRTPEAFVAADDTDETRPNIDEPPLTTRRPEPTRVRAEPPVAAVAAATAVADDTLSSESAVRFDHQDALAEADFHMAYGLYDQAADLVKIAIDREPGRRDLKMKLLEIYFVWGNRDLFLDTARDLHRSRAAASPAEWDKVVIMGRQIASEDPIFKGEDTSHVDLVDVNLEGGENRVDVDLFAEPEAQKASALDLEFGSGERKSPPKSEGDLDLNLESTADRYADIKADEPTRELDPLARTQETPTIESPQIDRISQTIREKVDKTQLSKADQTAELSLDDLGLDVDALEATGSLEETHALTREDDSTRVARPIGDDEMTQLAPSLSSFDRTMEAPRVEKFDIDSTGTIYIDQVDLAQNSHGGDTVEQARPDDMDSTASLQRLSDVEMNVDFSGLDEAEKTADAERSRTDDTLRHAIDRDAIDHFSKDVFTDEGTAQFSRVDLDVGDALNADDGAPTNRQVVTNEMELSELEPVTMSEVGTKLDLARAYMDMGDPDGARSILEEVVQEGNSNQKQEAGRLLDSIR